MKADSMNPKQSIGEYDVLIAEFGFGGKLFPTFPWLIHPLKATKLAWNQKKDVLPWLYWNAMLKGREWLARPFEN